MQDSNTAIEKAWRAFESTPDAATFEAFHAATRDLAARIAWRALGDSDWMEDAMQALFARLWQDRATRRIPAGLTAREALIRWTLNECRTLNRRRARNAQREAPIEAAASHASPNPGPAEAADHRIVAEAVRRILATLPDPYREALLACEIEGATHAEAGNILGIPARTVQTHVRRGKDLLARKLRKAGITLPAGAALALYAADAPAIGNAASAAAIIANAEATLSQAGPIVPAESAPASAGLLSAPVLATAAACAAGAAILVWTFAAPPQDSSSTNSPSSTSSTSTLSTQSAASSSSTASPVSNSTTTPSSSTLSTPSTLSTSSTLSTPSTPPTAVMTAADPDPEPAGPAIAAMGRIFSASTREGIAGATIGIMSYSMSMEADDLPKFDIAQIQTRNEATTAEDGSFTLSIPESEASQMGLFLFAQAEGHANQAVWFWPDIWKPLGQPQIEVPMPAAGSLSGRVVGPSGEPLQKFLVGFPMLSPFDFQPLLETGYLTIPAAVTLSDANGEFVLEGLPANRTLDLPVTHDDWPAHFEKGVLVGAAGLTITIPNRGETVRGIISMIDQPVTDANVVFSQPEMGGISDFTKALASPKSAKTDMNGRYELRGILPGDYSVTVSTADQSIQDSRSATIVAGHHESIDLSLTPPETVTIEFVATEHESGAPVPGVKLATAEFIMEIPGRRPGIITPAGTVVTDAEGRAMLTVPADWINRGQVPELLLPPGYVAAPDTYRGFAKEFGMYGHRIDPEIPHTIHLANGILLEGIVQDIDGNPAAGAWVHTTSNLVGVDCDESGRFQLTMQQGINDVLIARSARGGAIVPFSIEMAASGAEISLQPYGLLSGTLADSTGRGIANVGIGLDWIADIDTYGTPSMAMGFTRGDGRFLLRELIPGRYSIEMDPELQTDEAPPAELIVEIAPGQAIHNFDISTTKGRTFEGVVTNAEAEPLEGASVQLYVRRTSSSGRHVSPRMPSTKTEADGYWKLENVPDGDIHHASFSHSGYNQLVVEAGENVSLESPINAMLTPLNNVAIRVIDATTGSPIPRYDYATIVPHTRKMNDPFGKMSRTLVNDPTGTSPSWPQSQGPLAVLLFELDPSGQRTGRNTFRQFTIGSGGEEQILDITLGSTQPVTGRVVRALSQPTQPLEGARISVGNFTPLNHGLPIPKNPDFEDVLTGPDGNFTIELGPGLWELIASKGEHFSTKTLTVHVEDSPVQIPEPFDLLALSPTAN